MGFEPMLPASQARVLTATLQTPLNLAVLMGFEPMLFSVTGKRPLRAGLKDRINLAGATGFEPVMSLRSGWVTATCCTKLSHTPIELTEPFYYTLTGLSREICSTILTDPVDRGGFPAEAGTSKTANQVGFDLPVRYPQTPWWLAQDWLQVSDLNRRYRGYEPRVLDRAKLTCYRTSDNVFSDSMTVRTEQNTFFNLCENLLSALSEAAAPRTE